MDTKQVMKRQRRHFSVGYKRQVVEETLRGADSVSVVARRHDLNTNLLFTWRRQYERGELAVGEAAEAALVPVAVEPRAPGVRSGCRNEAELEVVLAQGHRVCVRGVVDLVLLRAALEVLSR